MMGGGGGARRRRRRGLDLEMEADRNVREEPDESSCSN